MQMLSGDSFSEVVHADHSKDISIVIFVAKAIYGL